MNHQVVIRFRADARLRLLASLFLAGMLLVMPRFSPAQVLYGSLVGNVKDPTGAVIPGADVSITQKETNQSRSSFTIETGAYNFPTIRTGTYTIKVTLAGFKEFIRTDVPVTLNTITRVDVTLEVGAWPKR